MWIRILKSIVLCILLLAVLIAQVAPYDQPYSINNNVLSSADQLHLSDGISTDFTQNAKLTLLPHAFIYRLTLSFDSRRSGHLEITNWQVPEGAKLFIFNDNLSYTGPYLKSTDDTFISGRFISDKITLEYIVPVNVEFIGNFIVEAILPDYKYAVSEKKHVDKYKTASDRERPKIMLTGYWPPTNEMVRHFSQDLELNPAGWKGENWEGLGYDVVSYFPQFSPADCNNCGQGFGDLEVDYQDYSQDFWPIVENVRPVGIITFSRGFNDLSWELENRLVNRTNWHDDYTAPFLPTPNPPDKSVQNYYIRYNSLPISEIISAIEAANLGLDPYLDNSNAGLYLSEFSGYHGVWYKDSYDDSEEYPCFASGHIHVGSQVDWDIAKEAAEISIRALIEYIDQFVVITGDCNGDGVVNILDVVALSSAVLGNSELTDTQILASDIDSNGELNVLDIIAIINLILE